MNVRDWLRSLSLEEYAATFERERIDIASVRLMGDPDLKELGLPLGPRLKIKSAIEALSSRPAPNSATDAPPGQGFAHSTQAERRQLTILFCDLVESTQWSQRLDPEQLRELMQTYQQACRGVLEKYDGHVAQYLGDGLMVYFGFPRAHEDDAERAVRSALEIVQAMSRIGGAGAKLQVRIGIATGTVVVGETGAGDASVPKLAVGETPNLAARLQGLAGTDEIVIGPSTHRLLGSVFDYLDMGERALKGILGPVHAYRVLREAKTEGRFEATRGSRWTPIIGRESEIALLMDRWEQAQAREGQVVLLAGEAGIGKSRITQALRERIVDTTHLRLRYQYWSTWKCWPAIRRCSLYSRTPTGSIPPPRSGSTSW